MSEQAENGVNKPEATTREAASAPGQPEKEQRLTVVGIGASAGGLVALQGFFEALDGALQNDESRDPSGLAFVVVTHMDPERESLLPEILQKHTAMPVRQVQDLTAIEVDHVYVIPPGRRILITDTHLDTEEFEEPRGQRTPIDFFFRSLAHVHRQAVAVILSGGGTDGAVGVKAIKEEGGLLMVQEPAEAQYDSMPRAAIATGLADVVLPVAGLARKLVSYRRNGVQVPAQPEELTPEQLDSVVRILTQVQSQTGHDFSQYKQSTILRRIQRRMQLHGHQTLDAYLGYLRHEKGEAQALFNDLLIGVTNFFRDRASWEAVGEQVMPRLFEGKEEGDTVRVWSIGCATGEEAYSLAILLLEARDRLPRPAGARPNLQIFASDLDDVALEKARQGIYPEAIEADVSPERLERYFIKEGHHYQVRQGLRDIVLFSNHSVLRDPPFSRLDLVSCRNLLIYLNRELQEKVFQIFHYALKPEAYLFLGNAESAEMSRELFRTLDKEHRIYRARPWRGQHPEVPTLPLTVRPVARSQQWRRREHGQRVGTGPQGDEAAYHRTMLEEAAPPSALVDENYHVLHLSRTAGRYLQLPEGTITSDLLQLVRPELKGELRTALFQALEENKSVVTTAVPLKLDGDHRNVTLAVRPRPLAAGDEAHAADGQPSPDGQGQPDGHHPAEEGEGAATKRKRRPTEERLALVFFLEDEVTLLPDELGFRAARAATEGEDDALVGQLEAEVRRLRERLQSTAEEYESSNEELKAANEELQSINEEYRSTTEELETSKEELQSVNEELQTVNAELKNKLEEVGRARSDMENLMAATHIATLFLDKQLRIERYTPAVAELFSIIPGDKGRPIDHLTSKLRYEALVEDARQVLKTLVPREREVRDAAGRWFLAQLRPYRTVDDRIDGVVITFIDISELKEVEEELQESEARYRALVTSTSEVVYRMSPDWGEMRQLYGRGFLADTVEPSPTWLEAYIPPKGQPRVTEAIEEAVRTKSVFELEHRVRRADGAIAWVSSRAVPLLDEAGEIAEWIGAASDITERKQAEERERHERAFLEKIVNTVREGLLVLRPDLTVEYANQSFYEMFDVEPLKTKDTLIYELGNGQWDIPELRRLLEEILPEEKVFNGYRVEHEFEDIGRRVMLLNARQLDDVARILLAIEDETGTKQSD